MCFDGLSESMDTKEYGFYQMEGVFDGSTPLKSLCLSNRVVNMLSRKGIDVLSQLMCLSNEEISNIPNLGAKSIDEINAFIAFAREHGFCAEDINPDAMCQRDNGIKPNLVINRFYPGLPITENTPFYFKSDDGFMYDDAKISESNINTKIANVFGGTEYNSLRALLLAHSSVLDSTPGLGDRTVQILESWLKERLVIIFDEEGTEDFYQMIKENLPSDESCSYRKLLAVIRRVVEDNQKSLELSTILYDERTIIAFEEYLLYRICGEGSLSQERYLSSLKDRDLIQFVHSIFDRLLVADKIEIKDGSAYILPTSLKEWMSSLKKEKAKTICIMRFMGKTLDEIGQILDITRERVRQIIQSVLKLRPALREDVYAYWFCKYRLTEFEMNFIFGTDSFTYNYLDDAYCKGDLGMDEIESDPMADAAILGNYGKYLIRDSIWIKDEYIPIRKDRIFSKLIEVFAYNEPKSAEEFYEYYTKFIKDNNIGYEDGSMLYENLSSFKNRVAENGKTICRQHFMFRFYDYSEYDAEGFASRLNLGQYKDSFISTVRIFNSNPELMKEYNILDSDELYSFLRKTESVWNANNKYDLKFVKMPTIEFGQADRKSQMVRLLRTLSPVKVSDFLSACEEEFGYSIASINANWMQYVFEYSNGDMLYYPESKPTSEELKYMKKMLVEDFYTMSEVYEIYRRRFPEKPDFELNSSFFFQLGFAPHPKYIIKSIFKNANDYFKHYFLSHDAINLDEVPSYMMETGPANYVFYKLKTDYDLLEEKERNLISFDYFNSKHDIGKSELDVFVNEALSSNKDDYFNYHSLCQKGFKASLGVPYGAWFYESLIKNNEKVGWFRFCGGYIMSTDKDMCNLRSFITRLLSENGRSMHIQRMLENIKEEYGISFDKYKMLNKLSDSGLYYDKNSDILYISKLDYYQNLYKHQ